MSSGISRILVALVGIPVFVAAVIYGSYYFLALVLAMTLIGLHELLSMCRSKQMMPQEAPVFAFGIGLVVLFYTGHTEWVLPALMAFGVLTLTIELFRNNGSAALNLAGTYWCIGYAGMLMASILLLRFISPSSEYAGAQLVFLVFLSIWACDTFAYYGGRLLGKRKFFERVSPKKTWEGAIAGFFGGFAGVYAIRLCYEWAGIPFILTLPQTLTIGFFAGTLGQIGDLAESLIKRDAQVKDSGALLPGHGGVLDRFDSMMFVAPATYLYVNYFCF